MRGDSRWVDGSRMRVPRPWRTAFRLRYPLRAVVDGMDRSICLFKQRTLTWRTAPRGAVGGKAAISWRAAKSLDVRCNIACEIVDPAFDSRRQAAHRHRHLEQRRAQTNLPFLRHSLPLSFILADTRPRRPSKPTQTTPPSLRTTTPTRFVNCPPSPPPHRTGSNAP